MNRNFSSYRKRNNSSPKSSFYFGKPSFGNKKRYPSRPRVQSNRFSGTLINPAKFINKAMPVANAEMEAPEHKFADFQIDGRLKQTIAKKGYSQPTIIQDKTIPHILAGSDVIGIANTGTGKTAAFLVPLINKVLLNNRERVLIITPTRELAMQIHTELVSFSQFMGIFSVVCIGGMGMRDQMFRLNRNPHFVIGTPGRLKDLVNRKSLRLENFGSIVLDEADRMLDMGFIDDIRFLMGQLPAKRQTLLFSATIPPAIEKLILTFLKNPVKISVKSRDTASNVQQDVIKVKSQLEKIEKLCGLLTNRQEFKKVLVFGRTKHGVERLCQTLDKRGFRSASIHGDKTQINRRKALDLFSRNYVQVLVATDVAARGLDIANITHVINYDLPATYEDYIHRIGRTGRADKLGVAYTFIESLQ